ncbi:hypothetical protein POX_e07189 [Penicillium oxalicum]|uniref:Histone deacetylase complex subunit SAP30 Sin3 binding domain-containing protein n=1 Tax=Penicillium oxalicum (strain 114-2 / CGMCC 5302) TaxID=933388 RepID=S7ZC59_PENO1|nr:hypothetical protein POX_e07189 [Penicillium oxalicum]EPS28220.1 hypothetical protein PDE_03166 [Penicillium oxalicum 114-2]KAI2789161.1 hypothetical protein POX_e07189 [Penicillium oxalicum]
MAPPRQRTAAIVDDSRSEASSGTREFKTSAPKSRKTGAAAKEKASVTSVPSTAEKAAQEQPRVPWSDLSLEILHAYRHVHKLPTPSAFSTDYSRLILSQGVGLRSPTALAARRAQSNRASGRERNNVSAQDADSSSASPLHQLVGQDRVSKDQFATVVRKHFNSAGLSEQETIARFLYTVREERRGRQFRLRFQP